MTTAQEMALVFERIRAAVFLEGTRPSPYDAAKHAANQAKFTGELRCLCEAARLRPDMTANDLWGQVWRAIRYAGFVATYVSEHDIPSLEPLLDDFRVLSGPEWHYDPERKQHGTAVRDFLSKTGRFAGRKYNKNERKLRRMLAVASVFQSFPVGVRPLVALFGEGYDAPGDDVFWQAHAHLEKLVGFTTALHVMMDVGFNCVKPDIWLVRLMCRLGWIEDVLPRSAPEQLIRRRYGTRPVAVSVITRARKIASVIHAWNPDAPLREFDLVMVKYGQVKGEMGIERSLHNEWRKVQRIMEWNPPS